MEDRTSLNWPLILGLGAFALIRPITRVVVSQLGIETSGPWLPVLFTVGISAVWIGVVGLGRSARPVLTLVLAGVVYAVLAMLLSAVLSVALGGELEGPLANPIAILPMLGTNALWGLVAGGLALALRSGRDVARSPQPH